MDRPHKTCQLCVKIPYPNHMGTWDPLPYGPIETCSLCSSPYGLFTLLHSDSDSDS